MSKVKGELEDLSFKYLYPEQYYSIVQGLDKKKEERELYLNTIQKDISDRIRKAGIKAEISARAKKIYSIYRKMERDNITLNQIFDIFALRVIVNNISECYNVLGIIHDMYKPMPRKIQRLYISTKRKHVSVNTYNINREKCSTI